MLDDPEKEPWYVSLTHHMTSDIAGDRLPLPERMTVSKLVNTLDARKALKKILNTRHRQQKFCDYIGLDMNGIVGNDENSTIKHNCERILYRCHVHQAEIRVRDLLLYLNDSIKQDLNEGGNLVAGMGLEHLQQFISNMYTAQLNVLT